MQEFDTLYSKAVDAGDTPARSVFGSFPTAEALGKRVVCRDAAAYRYLVFESWQDAWDYLEDAEEDCKALEEVIFPVTPQKLRFDLDGVDRDESEEVLRDLTASATAAFRLLHGDCDILPRFVGSASHKKDSDSWHVVMQSVAFRSSGAVLALAKQTLELAGVCRKYIDMGPYAQNKTRTFRMLNARKASEPRYKRACKDFDKLVGNCAADLDRPNEQFAITFTEGLPVVGALCNEVVEANDESFTSKRGGKILAAWKELRERHRALRCFEPRALSVGAGRKASALVSFRRLRSDMCLICSRAHSSDSGYLLLYPSKKGYKATLGCYRSSGVFKYLGICGDTGNPEEGSDGYDDSAGDSDESAGESDDDSAGDSDDGYINWMDRALAKVQEDQERAGGCVPLADIAEYCHHVRVKKKRVVFPEFDRTLFVRAPLMMGKTTALISWLRSHHPLEPADALSRKRIVILSFRIAFTMELIEKIRELGFISYNDRTRVARGKLTHPRVIVQMESLHRLDLTEGVDLLIIDEAVSVFLQVASPHLVSPSGTITRVRWLLRNCGELILMDAHMGTQALEIVREARGLEGATFYENTFSRQRALGKTYEVTASPVDWLYHLREACLKRERIVLCTNSRTNAEKYIEMIREWWDDAQIHLVSGVTPEGDKRDLFANLDERVLTFDVFAYTPVMTAGNSIECEHFEHVFASFGNNSCISETCMQMLARVRYPISGRHMILLEVTPTATRLPQTSEEVAESVAAQNRNACAEALAGYELDIDDFGRERMIPLNGFSAKMVCANIALTNRSRSSFVSSMLRLFGESGVPCSLLEPAPDRGDLFEKAQSAKDLVLSRRARDVIAADDITSEGYEELSQSPRRTGEEYAQMVRYRLRGTYDLSAEDFRRLLDSWDDLAGERVREIMRPQTAQAYRMLRLLAGPGGKDSKLARKLQDRSIRELEAAFTEYGVDTERSELTAIAHTIVGSARDQRNLTGFARGLKRADDCVKMLGFSSVFARGPLRLSKIFTYAGDRRVEFLQALSEASAGLGVKSPGVLMRKVRDAPDDEIAIALARALSSVLKAALGCIIDIRAPPGDTRPTAIIKRHHLMSADEDDLDEKIPIKDRAGGFITY